MNSADLQRYKDRLRRKQQELLFPVDADSPAPNAGGWESDPVDKAAVATETELQIRLHETDGRLLRAIDDALGRMRKGTYGICEACKQPISKVRLEAVPWARLCRACKEHERPAA